jgi:hypothetical protein
VELGYLSKNFYLAILKKLKLLLNVLDQLPKLSQGFEMIFQNYILVQPFACRFLNWKVLQCIDASVPGSNLQQDFHSRSLKDWLWIQNEDSKQRLF